MAEPFIEITNNISEKFLRKKLKTLSNKINARLKDNIKSSLYIIRENIAKSAPVVSGDLVSKIRSLPITGVRKRGFEIFQGKAGSFEVSITLNRKADKKILWVDRGTGIYGPNKKPITAKNGKFLQFKINGKFIRTVSILGQKPKKFIIKGINRSRLAVVNKIRSSFR